jgi:hypothetical protein
MQGLRDEFLARAGFAKNEDRTIGDGDATNERA